MNSRFLLSALLIAAVLAVTPARAADAGAPWSHRELPDYPALLRNLKIGGHVRLSLTVTTDGKVKQATVLGGNPMLAELSCIAVKKWVHSNPAADTKVDVELVFDPKAGVALGAD